VFLSTLRLYAPTSRNANNPPTEVGGRSGGLVLVATIPAEPRAEVLDSV
jgi:hypothetical protein